ncbi:MAG: phospho-N-acetylmuramoyl-pentapeptide-transferase, partial [Eubacteriales bacterium]
MNYNLMYVVALLATFGITVLISRKLIPLLKSRKMGQKILEIGPRWHKNKEGTPTMGGLAFIAAAVIVGIAGSVYLALTDGMRTTLPFMFTLALGVCGGLIGCVDDTAKLRKKQNEGLTAPQKFLLQLIAGALYLLGMTLVCGIDTTIYLPFFAVEVDLGLFYYVVALLLLTGMDN